MALKSALRLDKHDVTMKRADAFMLAMTGFIFANCISYFVRSVAPYVTGWGTRPGVNGWYEAIGFPLVLFDLSIGSIVPGFRGPWINWIGNLAIAITTSYLSATRFAKHLPPLWPGQSRAFRYSLRALLSIVTLVGVLLGIAKTSRSWGLLARNIVCLAGPVFVYAWSLYWRQASWIRLTVAAVGLTLLTLTVDFYYQEPPIDRHAVFKTLLSPEPNWQSDPAEWAEHDHSAFTRRLIGLTVIRATVPVFGLLSFLVIASVTYSMMRQYYPLWTSRQGGTDEGADI